MTVPFGIYVHIPFCSRKCPYCDFTTYAVPRVPQERYVSALLSELRRFAKHPSFRGRSVRTLFFGGGTPSLIDPLFIEQIVTSISTEFPTTNLEEVTLEANPGAVSLERLNGYRAAGVNRLSFGAQSLNSKHLSTLGRTHSRDEIVGAIANSRLAHFSQVSIDLLFGVPGQSIDDVRMDLLEMLDLGVDHVSAYGLTYEKGTPYFQSVERGVLKPLSDDLTADMYELLIDTLIREGFDHYEISNFAKDRINRSKHNMSYWSGFDYLGLGVGAHSFIGEFEGDVRIGGKRWANVAEPTVYMDRMATEESVISWSETLSRSQVRFEHLFVGLRRIEGVEIDGFRREFGVDIEDVFGSQLLPLLSGGLIVKVDGVIQLTRRGLLLADSVLERFAA